MRSVGASTLLVALTLAAASGLGAGACSGARAPDGAAQAPAAKRVSSNVLRGDYAGSKSCQPCHAEIYERWQSSAMRNMTRSTSKAAPGAPFAGEQLALGGDVATMRTEGGQRYVEVAYGDGRRERWLVTRTIGGRAREDFAGVLAPPGAPPPKLPAPAGAERILPGSYLLFEGSWRYKGYSVMVEARPGLVQRAEWSRTCIGCHNTLPALASLYDDLSAEPLVYQGAVSDALLPDARRWRVRVGSEPALASALREEIGLLRRADVVPDKPIAELLALAARSSYDQLSAEHLVEEGIGCEACHNGSAEHVADPSRLPSFGLVSEALRLERGADAPQTPAAEQNRVCARCHTVLFSEYEPTWEGGRRSKDPGGSTINSGEARDFLLGGCASALTCSTCHDPHGGTDRAKLEALATPAGNGVCTSCHGELGEDSALARHSRHAQGSPGSSCVACHMPRKNMGLAYEPTRYHRIGSPTDPERLERDRPIECALCHTEASVEQLVSWLEEGWQRAPSRGALTTLYGPDLSVNALEATVARGQPHERAIAAHALSAARGAAAAPLVTPLLSSDYPLLRYWARAMIEAATGAKLGKDPAHGP